VNLSLLATTTFILIAIGIVGIAYSVYKTPDDQLGTEEEHQLKQWITKTFTNN